MSDSCIPFRTVRRLSVRKAGIISKIDDSRAGEYARILIGRLEQKEIAVLLNEIKADLDLIIVLGGDGTLLHIAEQAARYSIPVTGINLGNLGFLTELTENETEHALEKMIDETVTIENRLMLKARLIDNGKHSGYRYALNEIVINKNTMDRLLHLATHAGPDYITTYKADGLIFSTPTGSTAYNLSAGGPLVHPGSATILVTPICPFMLSSRPIILPSTKIITTEFQGRGNTECAQVIIDGQHSWTMKSGSILEIQAAEHKLQLIASSRRDYFTVLRNKLHWGSQDDTKNFHP
jgi:NAD+ kinase